MFIVSTNKTNYMCQYSITVRALYKRQNLSTQIDKYKLSNKIKIHRFSNIKCKSIASF